MADFTPARSTRMTLAEKLTLAPMLIKSGMLPKGIDTTEKALVVMLTADELDIGYMQAFSLIYVINGKPTVSPQLMLALIQRSGLLEDIQITVTPEKATVMMKRVGQSPHTTTFSMEDARKFTTIEYENNQKVRRALADKFQWLSQPETMMKWRAVAACARVVFPDVIAGLYTAEEMGADVEIGDDGDMRIIDAPAAPKAALPVPAAPVPSAEPPVLVTEVAPAPPVQTVQTVEPVQTVQAIPASDEPTAEIVKACDAYAFTPEKMLAALRRQSWGAFANAGVAISAIHAYANEQALPFRPVSITYQQQNYGNKSKQLKIYLPGRQFTIYGGRSRLMELLGADAERAQKALNIEAWELGTYTGDQIRGLIFTRQRAENGEQTITGARFSPDVVEAEAAKPTFDELFAALPSMAATE